MKLNETAPMLLNDSKYSLFVGYNFYGKAKRIEHGAIRERQAEENLFIVAGLRGRTGYGRDANVHIGESVL